MYVYAELGGVPLYGGGGLSVPAIVLVIICCDAKNLLIFGVSDGTTFILRVCEM